MYINKKYSRQAAHMLCTSHLLIMYWKRQRKNNTVNKSPSLVKRDRNVYSFLIHTIHVDFHFYTILTAVNFFHPFLIYSKL